MRQYLDIGLNLMSSQFAGREEEISAGAALQGVDFIITGSDPESSLRAAEYAAAHPGSHFTAGVHPHAASSCKEDTIERLRALQARPGAVAVGECGLDYDRMYSPMETQKYWFERQIELAEECKKPLFLHEREAFRDFAEILERHPGAASRAVVHCFTGSRRAALRYLELGCYIGITGWICDKRRNEDLLDAMEVIPPERLMAETDAPYLLPRGIRGLKNPNRPENIRYVVARMAEAVGLPEEEMRRIVLKNAETFFGLP